MTVKGTITWAALTFQESKLFNSGALALMLTLVIIFAGVLIQ